MPELESRKTTFRTKTGYCNVQADVLLFYRLDFSSLASKAFIGDHGFRSLISRSVLTLMFVAGSWSALQHKDVIWALLNSIAGGVVLFGIVRDLIRANWQLPRSAIQHMVFSDSMYRLKRPYLEIQFEDSHGRIKKRTVMLPGWLEANADEEQRTMLLLRNEGLI